MANSSVMIRLRSLGLVVLTGLALGTADLPSALADAASTGAPDRFVEGISDLPLMPGLAPVPEETLVFDKPAGRIVQAVAAGRIDPKAVRAFYARTVPQLGWRPIGPDRFAREGEILRIDILQRLQRDADAPLKVRFTVSPG
jgi:hypothetical protein